MKSGFSKQHLRSFINRIEGLEEEKKAISDDIKELFAEAKGCGFDAKIMREVIRIRKMDRAEWEEKQAILDLYLEAMRADPEMVAAARDAIRPDAEQEAAASP